MKIKMEKQRTKQFFHTICLIFDIVGEGKKSTEFISAYIGLKQYLITFRKYKIMSGFGLILKNM